MERQPTDWATATRAVSNALWFAAFVAASVLLIAGQARFWDRNIAPGAEFAAFCLRYSDEPPFELIEPLPAAENQGVKSRDRVLAVNGRPVGTDAEPQAIAELLRASAGSATLIIEDFETGRPKPVTLLRDPERSAREYRETGLGRMAAELVQIVPDILHQLVLLGVAAILFVRRRGDAVALLLSFAFLLQIAGSSWLLLEWRAGPLAMDVAAASSWSLLAIVFMIFPDGSFRPRWTRWFAWVPTAAATAWVARRAAGVTSFKYETQALEVGTLLIGICALAYRYARTPAGLERQRLKWAVFGFALGTSFLALAKFAPPEVRVTFDGLTGVVWGETLEVVLTSIGWALFALGLLVAVIRYRLFDADLVISRSAVYGLLTMLFVPTFAVAQSFLQDMIGTSLGVRGGLISTALGAIVATLVVAPAKKKISDWTERHFHSALGILRRVLPARVADLRHTATLDELLAEAVRGIAEGLHAQRAAIVVDKADGRLTECVGIARNALASWLERWSPERARGIVDCDRADREFPLRLRLSRPGAPGDVLGWLFVGPRADGAFYAKAERDALAELAQPMARAIALAEMRNAREQSLRSDISALRERLASLEGELRTAKVRIDPQPGFSGRSA